MVRKTDDECAPALASFVSSNAYYARLSERIWIIFGVGAGGVRVPRHLVLYGYLVFWCGTGTSRESYPAIQIADRQSSASCSRSDSDTACEVAGGLLSAITATPAPWSELSVSRLTSMDHGSWITGMKRGAEARQYDPRQAHDYPADVEDNSGLGGIPAGPACMARYVAVPRLLLDCRMRTSMHLGATTYSKGRLKLPVKLTLYRKNTPWTASAQLWRLLYASLDKYLRRTTSIFAPGSGGPAVLPLPPEGTLECLRCVPVPAGLGACTLYRSSSSQGAYHLRPASEHARERRRAGRVTRAR
ncbi:hypothetical protein C2E23DRAFT_897142, partial [Lenzites betulinus]